MMEGADPLTSKPENTRQDEEVLAGFAVSGNRLNAAGLLGTMTKNTLNRTGFTLVEMVIVVAIIALIVAIALPSYENSVRKARRSAAQTELLAFANTAERFFTEEATYANAPLPSGSDTVFDYYTFSFAAGPSATGYTIQATPKSGTAQVGDKCGTMRLTNTGVKTATGATEANCWGTTSS